MLPVIPKSIHKHKLLFDSAVVLPQCYGFLFGNTDTMLNNAFVQFSIGGECNIFLLCYCVDQVLFFVGSLPMVIYGYPKDLFYSLLANPL